MVTPAGGKTLKGVKVTVSDLAAEKGGGLFTAANVTCEVTGYVKTRGVAAYVVGKRAADGSKMMRKAVNPRPGWWADPILPYLNKADVEPGTRIGSKLGVRGTRQLLHGSRSHLRLARRRGRSH